jgi:hypothetical protein
VGSNPAGRTNLRSIELTLSRQLKVAGRTHDIKNDGFDAAASAAAIASETLVAA